MAILAVLIFYSTIAHAAQFPSSVSSSNLTMAINSTATFINNINQSGYLIFYPNLTTAYKDLNLARNESQINPPYAYELLASARSSAQSQENSINQYKSDSLYVLIFFAVVLVIFLYVLMVPLKSSRRRVK
jgi:hypothetical protein